jgi:antitoxin Phd
MNEWPLHEAKNRLSALVDLALEEGPQVITRHGEPAVVVVAVTEFEKLRQPQPTLEELLLSAPDGEADEADEIADYIGPRSRSRVNRLG